jgi:hypothetical protein
MSRLEAAALRVATFETGCCPHASEILANGANCACIARVMQISEVVVGTD